MLLPVSGGAAHAQQAVADRWILAEFFEKDAWYQDQLGDPDSPIVREGITRAQWLTNFLELELERDRPEQDALRAIENLDVRFLYFGSGNALPRTGLPGLSCDAGILDYQPNPRGEFWPPRHFEFDGEYKARLADAMYQAAARYNRTIFTHWPGHPINVICRVREDGDPALTSPPLTWEALW